MSGGRCARIDRATRRVDRTGLGSNTADPLLQFVEDYGTVDLTSGNTMRCRFRSSPRYRLIT